MAETFATDQLHFEAEYRSKYSSDDLKDMQSKGEAMPPSSDGGDPSYPIKDQDDLEKAIKAVGRGNASHNAIRVHIMARAKALGLTKLIPSNWNADGSLAQSNAAAAPCPTCDGTGTIKGGSTTCSDCDGTGEVDDQNDDEEMSFKGPLYEYHRAKATELRGIERRSFGTEQFELRATDDGSVLKFSGYASLTETPYPVSFYTETIKRGAFKQTLGQSPDVQLLINHGEGGSGMPIARTGKNMTLVEDARGLKVDADLDPEDPDVQLLARKMKNGLIDQMSFAFQCTDNDAWNPDYTERNIKSVSIHRGDVSVVNQGASEATTASIRRLEALNQLSVRSLIGALTEWRDWTLLSTEQRAGAAISAATNAVLTKVMEALTTIDDNADEIIPALAELMGVPDPNEADEHNPDGSPKTGMQGAAKAAIGSGPKDAPNVSSATDGRALADKVRRQRQSLEDLKRKAI